MSRRYEISEQQWEAIGDQLPCQPGYKGRQSDNHLFINAVMFVAKCGIPWRDLPESGLVSGTQYRSGSADGQRREYGSASSRT